MELRGGVALVTGAGRRVGRAIALRLAQDGCAIAAHHHRSREEAESLVAECRALGVVAEPFAADLADHDAAADLVPRVIQRFGRLSVLVNNAAAFGAMTVDSFDAAAWERELRINLTAPMILTHAAAAALREARGRVVNLCDAAIGRPWPDRLAYVVSKGGLETLTRALARALAPEVNVVGIAPGVAEFPDEFPESARASILSRVPLRRAGRPQDIAAAVHFVLADGDYITGTILRIDGGRHVV